MWYKSKKACPWKIQTTSRYVWIAWGFHSACAFMISHYNAHLAVHTLYLAWASLTLMSLTNSCKLVRYPTTYIPPKALVPPSADLLPTI